MAKVSYGLQIYKTNNYGTSYVNVQIMRREHEGDRQDRPLGMSSDDQYRAYHDNEPKHLVGLQMQGLGMYGFVTSDFIKDPGDVRFVGFAIEYRDVYSVDLDDATRMARTLKLVSKRLEADRAHEPGDCFASLAAALRLSWVVQKNDDRRNGFRQEWIWDHIGEGRNLYRRRIDETIAAVRAAKFPQAQQEVA